jgi:hypothetical protein
MNFTANENGRIQADAYRYCGHVNWNWVLDLAMIDIGADLSKRVSRMRELPSYQHFRSKRGYALFRVETVNQGKVIAVWATSPALEFLDAKDSLFETLSSVGVGDTMPTTKILSWTCANCDEVGELPTVPALLKAPLGSAGDCLYFVHSPADVLCVVLNHKHRAESVPNFIDGLIKQYGKVPSWSLQELFPTLVLRNARKCQLRAYLVFVAGELFLYLDYEIRQPHWEEESSDADSSSNLSPLLQVDLEMCQNSSAVPYNFRRSKPSTSRLMLSEVEELKDRNIEEKVTALIEKAFVPLKDRIQANALVETLNSPTELFTYLEMAVAGLDILIDSSSYEPKIVELNNNPAMPQEGKKMTPLYREHLHHLARNIIGLGLTCHEDRGEAFLTAEQVVGYRSKFLKIF